MRTVRTSILCDYKLLFRVSSFQLLITFVNFSTKTRQNKIGHSAKSALEDPLAKSPVQRCRHRLRSVPPSDAGLALNSERGCMGANPTPQCRRSEAPRAARRSKTTPRPSNDVSRRPRDRAGGHARD